MALKISAVCAMLLASIMCQDLMLKQTDGLSIPGLVGSLDLDQCPCVRPKGSSTCIAYNPQYQAATLDEALGNFHDLRALDPLTAPLLTPGKTVADIINGNSGQCTTDECSACLKQRLNGLGQFLRQQQRENPSGFNLNGTFGELQRVTAKRKLNQRKFSQPGLCSSLKSKDSSENAQIFRPLSQDEQDAMIGKMKGTGLPGVSSAERGGTSRRRKRQSSSDSAYESVWDIDCRSKATPVEDGSNWLGLCDLCWQMGKLTSNYFPQYVNQLSCSSTSYSCLSDYGQCNVRHRSISVLKNYGTSDTPDWRQYSLNIPMCCDCQIKQDSALFNFAKN